MEKERKTVLLALAWHLEKLTQGIADYARAHNWHLLIHRGGDAPLVELWGRTQQKYTQLRKLLKRYDNLVTQINHEIASYIQSEDQHG